MSALLYAFMYCFVDDVPFYRQPLQGANMLLFIVYLLIYLLASCPFYFVRERNFRVFI